MCTINAPKPPAPVIPPPPPAPPTIPTDAATDLQIAPKLRQQAQAGVASLRHDLTIPLPGVSGSGLTIPR